MKSFSILRNLLFDLLLIVLLYVISGCGEKEEAKRYQMAWSGMDPLTIPYAVRHNYFVKGNLVQNPSFESGKYFYAGEDEGAFYVKSWSKVGEQVDWIDRGKISFSEDDVFTGSHAIRIHRTLSDETDLQGEGIMSDFIKVIPGNYQFTFHIRLENIQPRNARLGTKLYNAVDIRVLYYDRNKILLDSRQYYPYVNGHLDNSFKGYPFSNFWYIEKFNWGKVVGRTYNYPFSEGDIPDNTQFVKLFFGLKGTGTMWIDDVDYRLSKWNFTTLERVRPYFDSSLTLTDLLLPTPKKITNPEAIPYYIITPDGNRLPVIVIPEEPSRITVAAARLLRDHIENHIGEHSGTGKPDIPILRYPPERPGNYSIIFSIGKTTLLNRTGELPQLAEITGIPQAYLVHKTPGASTPVVFLAGNEPSGDYYAVTTALQLFDQNRQLFHCATITDYPDFSGRSYIFSAWQDQDLLDRDIAGIPRMSLLKFNTAYIPYTPAGSRKKWYLPDTLYIKGVKEAGDACIENPVMDLAIMVNPYSHFGSSSHTDSLRHSIRQAWYHSDPRSLELLENAFAKGLNAGATTITLMADDFMPYETGSPQYFTLYTSRDKQLYGNLQNAHAGIINHLHQWLQQNYPGTRIEFCPPWYMNELIDRSAGRAESYFRDLVRQIPEDVSILWTGNTLRSLSYDPADLKRYRDLTGRSPLIWDNTLYARGSEEEYGGYPAMYPGKVRMCNLFEPYDVLVPDSFFRYFDDPRILINTAAADEISRIKYATVADFVWNGEAYNPDLSLWKVLLAWFGREQAILLLEFNDAYYGLVDVCMKIEKEGNSNKLSRQGEAFAERLQVLCSGLSGSLRDNPGLAEQLNGYTEKCIDRFSRLNKTEGQLFHRDSSRR